MTTSIVTSVPGLVVVTGEATGIISVVTYSVCISDAAAKGSGFWRQNISRY
jgi:hypothetical protein